MSDWREEARQYIERLMAAERKVQKRRLRGRGDFRYVQSNTVKEMITAHNHNDHAAFEELRRWYKAQEEFRKGLKGKHRTR